MTKIVGEKMAMKMVMTADGIKGTRAGELGLAECVPADKDFNA